MRALRVQVIAWFTALAVLLPGSAFARTQYFCRMMNRVAATCCCQAERSANHRATSVAQVRATDCCQKITTAARSMTARALATDDSSVPPVALTATVPDAVYVFPKTVAARSLPPQARAPPGVGPPLFILNCSLLT